MPTPRKIHQYILLLLYKQPMHGFLLCNKINRLLKGVEVDTAGVYRALNKLTKQKAVTYAQENKTLGPAKKVFYITDEGRNLIFKYLEQAKNEIFNLKLFVQSVESITNN